MGQAPKQSEPHHSDSQGKDPQGKDSQQIQRDNENSNTNTNTNTNSTNTEITPTTKTTATATATPPTPTAKTTTTTTTKLQARKTRPINYAVGMFGTSIPINMFKTYAFIFYVDRLSAITADQFALILAIYTVVQLIIRCMAFCRIGRDRRGGGGGRGW